jgi:hypothetical protein
MQGVQIRGYVAAIVFADIHIRHDGMGFDFAWMLNPMHHVRRRIGELTGEISPISDAIQRGAHQPARSGDSGNGVTSIASIFSQSSSPGSGVAAVCENGCLPDFPQAKVGARRQARRGPGCRS